jgi:hypothetical protein
MRAAGKIKAYLGILEAPCKNMGLRHGACINAAFFVTH